MKKLIIAILLLSSASFAEGISEGKYLLIRHNRSVEHQKVCEITIYKEGEFKYITMVNGNFMISTPLKIIEHKSGDFIAVSVLEKSYVEVQDLKLVMFSADKNPRQNLWVCSLATFDASGHKAMREVDKYLLYQLNTEDIGAGK